MSKFSSQFLNTPERDALKDVTRRRKVDALVWKRARCLLLLDAGEEVEIVCRVLEIGPTVLSQWHSHYAKEGLSFLPMKDYSPREGHLSHEQMSELKAHFSENSPRDTHVVRHHIFDAYGQSYSKSGAIKLMERLGFKYKKPKLVPPVVNEVEQEAFIKMYESLCNQMLDDEAIVFADAVHPEHQSRPAHGWFLKESHPTLPASSGRKRLNIHGALNLETGKFCFVESEKINAETTRQLLEKIEIAHPDKRVIHVGIDNARYHHAKILKPWLAEKKRKVKLLFLPAYSPHLNPIERLWGIMHKFVTHNKYHQNFDDFTEAIFTFFRKILPENWEEFCSTVTDNFRIISKQKLAAIQ